MERFSFALVPSPLVGAETLEPLRDELMRRGHAAVVVPGELPMAAPFLGGWARSIAKALPEEPVVVAGHSGAGPVLELVAEQAKAKVEAVIGLDATLLDEGARLIDTFDETTLAQAEFREAFARGVFPNPWRSPAPWVSVGIPAEHAATFAAGARELPLGWYQERAPHAASKAPHGYLAFVPNRFYAPIVARCRSAGWFVRELAGSHFEFLVHPVTVAEALEGLTRQAVGCE